MIEYTIYENENNSITFSFTTSGVLEDYSDNFLILIVLQNGFSGNLGFGELVLMVSNNYTGEITSPIYENINDRQAIINKINLSLGQLNG